MTTRFLAGVALIALLIAAVLAGLGYTGPATVVGGAALGWAAAVVLIVGEAHEEVKHDRAAIDAEKAGWEELQDRWSVQVEEARTQAILAQKANAITHAELAAARRQAANARHAYRRVAGRRRSQAHEIA